MNLMSPLPLLQQFNMKISVLSAYTQVFHSLTKRITIDFHFIIDQVVGCQLCISHVHTFD